MRLLGYKEALCGTNPKLADELLYRLIHYIINDQHSVYVAPSHYSGYEVKAKLEDALGQGPCREETTAMMKQLAEARSKYYPDGVPGYEEIGNTAYIIFDEFSKPTRNYPEEPATAEDVDTIGIISYSFSQILRENSPVKNVVLDLSANTGGMDNAAVFVISWFLGDASLSQTDNMTGAMCTSTYRADVNRDRVFDEKDTVSDKNLFFLISPCSFSCGNLVPCVFKDSGKVTLIGRTSGGGSCSVMSVSTTWGTSFQISSNQRLSFLKNGSFYDVDRGADQDFVLISPEDYYNRKGLTEYINGLKIK